MKKPFQFTLTAMLLLLSVRGQAQSLNLLSVGSQGAVSESRFFGGNFTPQSSDVWSGSFDFSITGSVSGSSSLPNPGLESSASSSFVGDQLFGPSLWDLSGTSQTVIDTGLGNPGGGTTISSLSGLGASLTFSVDSPFALSLQSSLSAQFVGNAPSMVFDNRSSVRLFAVVLDGVFVNQYVADWDTITGSSGGMYSGSWNSAVFRLEFNAGTLLSSGIPDAFGTAASSYDLLLSVAPVPEPSGALLALLGGGWFLGLRRRRA